MSSYLFVCSSIDSPPPRPFSMKAPWSTDGYGRPDEGGMGREIAAGWLAGCWFRLLRNNITTATIATAITMTATPMPMPTAAPCDKPPPAESSSSSDSLGWLDSGSDVVVVETSCVDEALEVVADSVVDSATSVVSCTLLSEHE